IAKNNLAHAYLFVGPEGTGKHEAAIEILSSIFHKEIKWDKITEAGVLLVKREVDAKTGKTHKEISIEAIHKVSDYLNHSSFIEGKQVVIINEAEFLSKSAANALLKTLEEPKSRQALLILIAADENKILATIKSRCQIIRFFSVATKKIYNDLISKGAKPQLAEEISKLSSNQPERASEMFEDSAFYNFYKTEAERFLGTLNGSLKERWQKVEPVFKDKEDHIGARDNLISVLEIWLGFWRDSLLLKVGGAESLIKNISYLEQIKTRSVKYSLEKIREIILAIEQSIIMLRQNIHPRLILENLILSYY
ncbi:MAG: AAA family ATPase, partial [Candidatus Magasanikbacteria bacterium]|nr:AAA family ATPase [Candidatus Magasanikbacteria bacterium]